MNPRYICAQLILAFLWLVVRYGTLRADKHVHAQHHGIAISTLSISTETSAFDIHQTNRKSVSAVSNENISSLVVWLPKSWLVN
jgi:hypothetical protein